MVDDERVEVLPVDADTPDAGDDPERRRDRARSLLLERLFAVIGPVMDQAWETQLTGNLRVAARIFTSVALESLMMDRNFNAFMGEDLPRIRRVSRRERRAGRDVARVETSDVDKFLLIARRATLLSLCTGAEGAPVQQFDDGIQLLRDCLNEYLEVG